MRQGTKNEFRTDKPFKIIFIFLDRVENLLQNKIKNLNKKTKVLVKKQKKMQENDSFLTIIFLFTYIKFYLEIIFVANFILYRMMFK